MVGSKELFKRRRSRVRTAIKKYNKSNRIRLSVFRSNQHIYAQLIDDNKGITVASASTLEAKATKGSNIEAAMHVGSLIADKAQKFHIKEVVFDKGGYIFHGRVKALADAAREKGLLF